MSKKLKVNGLWTQFLDPMIGRESFETHGALSGRSKLPASSHWSYSWQATGQLPEHYWESFAQSTYAVYSYNTPIAWLNEDGVWISPDVKYSVTTSKHQNKINTAISAMVK